MSADRRILTPIVATLIAGGIVGAATLGGSLAGDAPAVKTDRFALVGDNLCKNQSWPNLSAECLAWAEGEPTDGRVRFVTISSHDADGGSTTLTRIREITTH